MNRSAVPSPPTGRVLRCPRSLFVRAGAAALLLASMVTSALVGALQPAVAQEDALATAAVVPDSAVVYVEMNLDLESDQWQQTDDLLARAGFPDALDELEASILEDIESESEATVDPDAFFGGEIAVVVTDAALATLEEELDLSGLADDDAEPEATPGPEAATGIAAIIRAEDPDTVHDQLLALQAEDAAGDVEETDYNGVTISFVPADDDDVEEGSAVALVDEYVVVAERPADIEPIIDTAAGDRDSLADLDALSDVRAELNDEFVFFAFVNGTLLADALGEEFVDAVVATSPDMLDADALDFYAGIVGWADQPGFRLDTIVMPAEGATLPTVADNFETTLDQRVPADATAFLSAADLGPTGALDSLAFTLALGIVEEFGEGTPVADEIGDVMDAFSAEAIEGIFAQAEAIAGFDLRDDLFRQFAGEHAAYVSVTADDILAGDFSALLVSALDDPATVTDSLEGIADLIAQSADDSADFSTRQENGSEIYVIEDTTAEDTPVIEYGVVDDQFVLGVGDALDEYLSGDVPALADDEQYQRVLATLPDEHNQVVYLDLTQIIPLLELATEEFEGSFASEDASPDCAEFDTQEEAQDAFEEDIFTNSGLDTDFDGDACEDYFAPATPEPATPEPANPYAAIEALASVGFERDGMTGSNSILYIAE